MRVGGLAMWHTPTEPLGSGDRSFTTITHGTDPNGLARAPSAGQRNVAVGMRVASFAAS
jgi:hypothetical protein